LGDLFGSQWEERKKIKAGWDTRKKKKPECIESKIRKASPERKFIFATRIPLP
jgi:hypothetical protein